MKKSRTCAAIWAIEVNSVAPRSAMAIGKKLRRVRPQIIPFRAKVVVDHIQQNHESAVMRALNQIFKIFGTAISAIGSEWENAVISPIALAGKVGDRHYFERRDSNIRKIVEPLASRGKSSGWRKRSDMQFVDDSFFPATAAPRVIAASRSWWGLSLGWGRAHPPVENGKRGQELPARR